MSWGSVNPAIIFKPEFYILFAMLNMNMYSIITIKIINHKQIFPI